MKNAGGMGNKFKECKDANKQTKIVRQKQGKIRRCVNMNNKGEKQHNSKTLAMNRCTDINKLSVYFIPNRKTPGFKYIHNSTKKQKHTWLCKQNTQETTQFF